MFNFYFKFRWNVKDVTQKCNGVEDGVMDGCTKCSDFYTAGCDPVLKSVLIYSVFNQDHNLFPTLTKLFGCRDHECLNHALVGTSGFKKKRKMLTVNTLQMCLISALHLCIKHCWCSSNCGVLHKLPQGSTCPSVTCPYCPMSVCSPKWMTVNLHVCGCMYEDSQCKQNCLCICCFSCCPCPESVRTYMPPKNRGLGFTGAVTSS